MDGITMDQTERRQLENSLRERTRELQIADRRKDEFLAMLAHELRTPLQPLVTGIELLEYAETDRKVLQEARQIMTRQIKQLTRLVDDLLDLSRAAAGKIVVHEQPLNVADVLHSSLEMVRPLMQQRGHSVNVAVAGSLPVRGDAGRLTQVFSNILNNAAKYTPPSGHICLTAALEDEDVVVRIRDNGLGISAEMLQQVFEMFAQAPHQPGALPGGLGVGLSLVRWLVERHGGSVVAASDGPGTGSTFTVRLPRLA
jgi:signal transduction histidine kinase